MLENIIQEKDKCMWNAVAENDRIRRGDIVTFPPDHYCHGCEGYNKACNGYVPLEEYLK